MADKLMYSSSQQSYPIYRFQEVIWTLNLNKPANQNSINVPKVVKPTNKKTRL